MALSFQQSGGGASLMPQLTLEAVQNLALSLGFARPGVAADKPLTLRVDMAGFFKAVGVNSLSTFKEFFCEAPMAAPKPGQVGKKLMAQRAAEAKEATPAPAGPIGPDVAQYDTLAASWESMQWRIIPRPGGATMKPETWYELYGCVQQVANGDVKEEKPMWAATGGLDFDGREKWDWWKKMEGKTTAEAKQAFCSAYGRAMADRSANFRVTHS